MDATHEWRAIRFHTPVADWYAHVVQTSFCYGAKISFCDEGVPVVRQPIIGLILSECLAVCPFIYSCSVQSVEERRRDPRLEEKPLSWY